MRGSRKAAARPASRLIAIRHIDIMTDVNLKDELTLILDSKLISATLYDIKLVDCGDYSQVYIYENKKLRRKAEKNPELDLKKYNIENMVEKKSKVEHKRINLKSNIEPKNIMRSKLECQRIAKSNIKDWQTFITLTFAENITDVKSANKKFKYFIDKVRRIKPDLKYLCIPEFQKRGAIHYHLLTNISIKDNSLIYNQEDNPKFKHIKFWNDGFNSVEVMKGDVKKIIGYISKYMTKDIDNRLFNHRRYFYSQNLEQPKISYINLDKDIDNNFYKKIIQDKNLIYQNEYTNPYDDTKVLFLEYLKK